MNGETLSDYLIEWRNRQELRNREFPDWEYQRRSQQGKFSFQPRTTVRNFDGRRNAITSFKALARKATAYRRKIYAVANLVLRPGQPFGEPLEKGLPGSPGKRPTEFWLFITWRLPN